MSALDRCNSSQVHWLDNITVIAQTVLICYTELQYITVIAQTVLMCYTELQYGTVSAQTVLMCYTELQYGTLIAQTVLMCYTELQHWTVTAQTVFMRYTELQHWTVTAQTVFMCYTESIIQYRADNQAMRHSWTLRGAELYVALFKLYVCVAYLRSKRSTDRLGYQQLLTAWKWSEV
jgi:hypothetical protein